jgi:hypothetical protein
VFGFQVLGDELREQRHAGNGCLVGQVGRNRVERAQGAEVAAVGAEYGYRNIAIETVHARRVVVLVPGVGAGVVDDYRQPGIAHFLAQRGGHVEPVANLEAEAELVVHSAIGPRIGRYARDAHEAQASEGGDCFEDGGNR